MKQNEKKKKKSLHVLIPIFHFADLVICLDCIWNVVSQVTLYVSLITKMQEVILEE